MAELLKAAEEQGTAIALVQEPYVGSTGTVKQVPGTTVIQCTLNRQKRVKAAVIVFGDRLKVTHDPQLVTETEAAVLIEAGPLKLGIVSVYYEGDDSITPYIERTRAVCEKLSTHTANILIGGDVNAWSHWWGSPSEDDKRRGQEYVCFLSQMDYHVLNNGSTPTFEVYRRGKLYSSFVDVTSCSTPLLGKINNWNVDRNLTTADHNAITFTLEVGEKLHPIPRVTTRRYNCKKAKWEDFDSKLRESLAKRNISVQTIESVSCHEEMESCVQAYIDSIEEACVHAIPKVGNGKTSSTPPWWTSEINTRQKDVLRKKRRIKNAAPIRKESVLKEYQEAKEEYLRKASEAQTESWKTFCCTQDRESMWDGIYRVIRKTAGRQEDMLLRNPDGRTLSQDESAALLADTFYPEDSVTTDKPYHKQLRQTVESAKEDQVRERSEEDPSFTEAEVEAVLKTQNPKKAPGPDGFTADICARAVRCEREVFVAIANKCLAISYFPPQWKTAHVVILRKPGKDDYTHPKSYRPIGLLSVLGKILEKLLVGRLQYHLLPTLNPRQYGFMPQRGTEDALYDLVKHIRSELQAKKSVIVVSLDIEGAFDNAWWPALKHQLLTRKCPTNLYKLVDSYLTGRKITVNYAGSKTERTTTKGCVQGSIGGPTFWNLILDPLLQLLSSEEVYCQAFADDGVLVFSGKSIAQMEDNANNVLAKVTEWGENNKLNFAAHKTNVMLLTRKLKFNPPVIQMSGTTLAIVDEIKLLGLIIDKNLNFNAHVKAVCKKASNIYKQLACAARVTWGLNGEIIRTIYVAVIEPIITYGSCAWSDATKLETNKKQLEAIQRCFAQKICKAYRTASLTSVLALSGTLPLDLRIQENAALYEAKKGISSTYLPPGRQLEQKVKFTDFPHPATQITTEYELLENMDSDTETTLQITGPQVYTDGSKMEGKVGAALTWWENGRETSNDLFGLDQTCTVFQSELYALHMAIKKARDSGEEVVNILSDSRSSLELLGNPKLLHPLVKTIKEDIAQIRQEGRRVRLFWLRAHVGTPGNERADELAKTAATKTTSNPDYAEVPLSYVRKSIRSETIQKWQDRYDSSETGSVTKMLLPDVSKAYRMVREVKPNHLQIQILTNHGGFGEYLHRFNLRPSPGCECDATISESVWHLLLDCPRFQTKRHDLTQMLDFPFTQHTLHKVLECKKSRQHLLDFMGYVAGIASRRNSTLGAQTLSTTQQTNNIPPTITTSNQPIMATKGTQQLDLLTLAHTGRPGVRLRGVALFMDNNTERLGIAFCNAMAKNRVVISPGLAALVNGSTSKITMRRKVFKQLPSVEVENNTCRLVRKDNKVIALFCAGYDITEFEQVCAVLTSIGDRATPETSPRKISVDAMTVQYIKGKTEDYMGIIRASKHHELVVYEDRDQSLNYLLTRPPEHGSPQVQTDHRDHPVLSPDMSGSERLQLRIQTEREEAERSKYIDDEDPLPLMLTTLGRVFQAIPSVVSKKLAQLRRTKSIEKAVEDFFKPIQRQSSEPRGTSTRADMGQVEVPKFISVHGPRDHIYNAFMEFLAVTKATRKVNTDTCEKIIQVYRRETTGLLRVLLNEAGAAIYDNDNAKVLMGSMSGSYMAAYSGTCGFVESDEERTESAGACIFKTPSEDPIVVVAKCTKVMLDDRILEMANTILGSQSNSGFPEHWTTPNFSWVNGVPGCGKTTWIISNFDADRDIVVTTTTQAAKDLREKLEPKIGDRAKKRVRTMASLLVNGIPEGESCTRLMVDEALMNHFGSIVLALQLARASETLLIGDNNQLPYIDRNNLFPLIYNRPNLVTNITKELLCTYRNPMDVAYALNEIYSGIYSANSSIKSLKLKRYTGSDIPKADGILYLVHTQAEKALLLSQEYGTQPESRTLTIHEAQGLTYDTVVIVRTTTNPSKLPQSVPHAVVAISRHTKNCTYYTDSATDDATARLILRAENATATEIVDYNLKMSIRRGDDSTRDKILQVSRELGTNPSHRQSQ